MKRHIATLNEASGRVLNDLVTDRICDEIQQDDQLRETLKAFVASGSEPTAKNLRGFFRVLKLGATYKKKALLYLRAMFKLSWLKTNLNAMAMKRTAVGKLKQVSAADLEKLKQKEVSHVRVNETHSK